MNTRVSALLPLAIFLSLSGCATPNQLSQVRAFSAAATAYATEAQGAFTQINDLSVERQLSEVALKAHPLEDAVFTGVLDADDRLKLRLQSLAALGSYAAALDGLAGADNRAAIDRSSAALYGALVATRDDWRKLNGNGAGLSDADLGVVATSVKALADAATEARRAEALQTIVTRTDPAIQALCTALASDFRASIDSFRSMADSIYTDQYKVYQRLAPNLSYDASLDRLHDLRTAYLGREHAADLLERLSQAALALGKAHAAVRDSFTQPSRDPAELLTAIGQLTAYADDIRSFNARLK